MHHPAAARSLCSHRRPTHRRPDGRGSADTRSSPVVSFEEIRYDVSDGVLTVTLHRPDRLNAFTERMSQELIDSFDRADADDDVRAVVLTGAGRAFCAGADLGAGGDTFAYPDGPAHRDTGGRVALRVFESLKP